MLNHGWKNGSIARMKKGFRVYVEEKKTSNGAQKNVQVHFFQGIFPGEIHQKRVAIQLLGGKNKKGGRRCNPLFVDKI
jgi:hypothetical protein